MLHIYLQKVYMRMFHFKECILIAVRIYYIDELLKFLTISIINNYLCEWYECDMICVFLFCVFIIYKTTTVKKYKYLRLVGYM